MLVSPLDHLLAPLMLEIDIDIRQLLVFSGDEALEEQATSYRIDGGDAKHIPDGGVGGRAAALAENTAAAGPSYPSGLSRLPLP
jgi:hypothetical protein